MIVWCFLFNLENLQEHFMFKKYNLIKYCVYFIPNIYTHIYLFFPNLIFLAPLSKRLDKYKVQHQVFIQVNWE